jgi:hypothetical protein
LKNIKIIRLYPFLAGEINSIDYNYDPRYLIEPVRGNQSQTTPTPSSSHYAPLTTNERFLFLLEILLFIFNLVNDMP